MNECEHQPGDMLWSYVGALLGLLVVGVALAGTCGLTVGVCVRAYAFAAGEP